MLALGWLLGHVGAHMTLIPLARADREFKGEAQGRLSLNPAATTLVRGELCIRPGRVGCERRESGDLGLLLS